jgi:hypothetical protein
MAFFEWRDRLDKQASPHLVANELWSIPSSTPKTLLLLEVPNECGFASCCGVIVEAEPPHGPGCFVEVSGAPATCYEFKVDYTSGLVCFATTAPVISVCACYYGLGSLVWARDVNELGTVLEGLDVTKLTRDGSLTMCGNLDLHAYNVLNAACVSGICVATHNHTGGTMGSLISAGTAIPDGTLDGDKLIDGTVHGVKLSAATVGSAKLTSDAASLTQVSGGLLCTNGTTLGFGRIQCANALFTFKSDTNTIPKMYLYDDGSRTFGFGIIESGADRRLDLFFPPSATNTNTLVFALGYGGTPLMCMKTGDVTIDGSAIRVNTSNHYVSIGTGALPAAAQLEVGGTVQLPNTYGLNIKSSGGASQSVAVLTGGNVLQIGSGASINCLELYGGGSAKVCISASGVCGGLSNWSDDVTIGGTAPVDVRLYTQGCTTGDATRYSFIAADSTSNPILGVRNDCRVSIANANYDETLTVNGNTKVCGALVATGSMTATSYSSGGNISFTTSATINPTPGSFALCVCAQKLCIYGVGTTCGVFILPTGYSGSLTKGMLWVV